MGQKMSFYEGGCKIQLFKNAGNLKILTGTMICAPVNFSDIKCLDHVPSKPGWYFIKTNTPITAFQDLRTPMVEHHKDIPECIKFTNTLLAQGFAIIDQPGGLRVVYNGETKSLRQRAKEHFFGKPGTYCLGISDYPTLKQPKCKWEFCYVEAGTKDMGVRLFGEQIWRTVNGWPILCER